MTANLRTWAGALVLAAAAAAPAVAQNPSAEDLARRQFQSGEEFMRNGRYAEALKDFDTVAQGHPESSVADDALLAIATYHLEIARDPAAAVSTTDQLLKRYPATDSAPMGYVLAGRAAAEMGTGATVVDAALAQFDRVPRLFPQSDAVAPALYYAAELEFRVGRGDRALDRLYRLAAEYPRSLWAARGALIEAETLVSAGRPLDAMESLQRVVRRFGAAAVGREALERNTILYRLYVRPPDQPAWSFSGRQIGGEATRLRNVEAVAVGEQGRIYAGGRGITVLDEAGTLVRTIPGDDVRQVFVDSRGRLTAVLKGLLMRDRGDGKGVQRIPLTAARPDGTNAPRLLEDLAAGAALSGGDMLAADRSMRAVYRFDASAKYVSTIATARVSRVAVGPNDEIALLDDDQKSITWLDRAGQPLGRILKQGTGYSMDNPRDLAFDAFGHLYVLDRSAVHVFGRGGRFVTSASPAAGSGALRDANAFALDPAGRLFVHDSNRILVYQ